jgi:hypothetical protein
MSSQETAPVRNVPLPNRGATPHPNPVNNSAATQYGTKYGQITQ